MFGHQLAGEDELYCNAQYEGNNDRIEVFVLDMLGTNADCATSWPLRP